MYCMNCGAQLAPESMFCGVCGTKVTEETPIVPTPEKKPRSNAKLLGFLSGFLVVVFLAGILLMTGIFGGSGSYEEGYSSAEDAAMAYLEGLRNADVEKMLSSFAAESRCRNYNFTYYEPNLYRHYQYLLPNCEELAYQYQYAYGTRYILENYLALTQRPKDAFEHDFKNYDMEAFSYSNSPYSRFSAAPEELEEYAEILRDERWLDELSDMEIGEVLDAEDFLEVSRSKHRDTVERLCENYGYDDIETVVIEVTIGRYDLYYVMDTVCIDGSWFNFGCFISDMYDFDAAEGDYVTDLFILRD